MSKDQWLIEYEQAIDDYIERQDREYTAAWLKQLGMREDEIEAELRAADGEEP